MPVIHLIDTNRDMVDAWRRHFAGCYVEIVHGPVSFPDYQAVVSPANSFGYMDAGFCRSIVDWHGWGIQAAVRDLIRVHWSGEMPVGASVAVDGRDGRYVIAAPTMRMPGPVPADSINPYLAFRAVLRQSTRFSSVAVTGMCTGWGGMKPDRSAALMRVAWDFGVIDGLADITAVDQRLKKLLHSP